MTIKFCVKCGSPIKEGAKFCSKCGWKLPEAKEERSKEIKDMPDMMTTMMRGGDQVIEEEPLNTTVQEKSQEIQREKVETYPTSEIKEENTVDYEMRPPQSSNSPPYDRNSSFSEEKTIKTAPSIGNLITIAISSMVIIVMVILLIMELG